MSKQIIKAVDLCKTYSNEGVETKALCGVSFDVEKGDFLAIMGPSGSGKSTLMQILGFLDRPSGGKYLFEGQDVSRFSDDHLAKIRNEKVGFIFQSFNLLPRTSVFQNVELPLLYSEITFTKTEIKNKVEKALAEVFLEKRMTYLSNQLSGGEKQRVAIARALINDPEIIFADEPTGNLDSKAGLQVMKILQKLNNQGKTIILVTHETFTAQHAKRILMMKDGNLVGDGLVKNRRIAEGEELLK